MVSLVTIFQHSHLEQELYHWQIKPAWDEFMVSLELISCVKHATFPLD